MPDSEIEEVKDGAETPVFDMSDEDFMKSDEPATEEVAVSEDVTEPEEKTPDAESTEPEEETTSAKIDSTDETDTKEEVETESEAEGEDSSTGSIEEEKETTESESEDKQEDVKVEPSDDLAKIMSPFTTNGQTMTPKSPDDVIRLMQMGANYHKKMAGLKPSMKYLKLLEKNDLLDQDKLNYLIDLDKKDPAAILKLVKESGLDPMEMDTKKDNSYTPTSRSVSDTEIDLDSVLADIRETTSYQETLNVVTEVWDDASRSALTKNPQGISVLNGHVANGVYHKVMEQVNYERSLGNLQGVSDLDAYKQMGDAMSNAGTLDPTPTTTDRQVPAKVEKVIPKKKAVDTTRSKRRKAASPSNNKGKTAVATFNPMEMSDEDILKFDESTLPTD